MQKILAAVVIQIDPAMGTYFEDYIVVDCERDDIIKIDDSLRARLDDILDGTPVEEVLEDVMSQLGLSWTFFNQDSAPSLVFDAATIFSM